MTSSLVDSEMCIRDRQYNIKIFKNLLHFPCKKPASQAAFIHLYVLMHLACKAGFLCFIITLMSSSCTHKPFAYALHCMLLQAAYFIPIKIFSSVIGSSLILTPTALYTAFAIAGDGVLITISPMDFAPNGPVGS